MQKTVLFVVFLLSFCARAHAQQIIKGTVQNAATGRPLPGANIIVKGTFQGTISNVEGKYALPVPDSLLPVTVRLSFIGFQSQQRVIARDSGQVQNFKLRPSVSQMKQDVVVADRNTGDRIMRKVIKRKKQWRKKLHTFEADAYTRQNLYRDTALVMITETMSTSYWDRKKGHRDVIHARKQTANINAADNVAGTRYIPNFYDNNIEMLGFDMVGITKPKALKYYNFKLAGTTSQDGQLVYKIRVRPRRKLQPLFRGTAYVLNDAYALLKVELRPTEVVKFPPPIQSMNAIYEQQYRNFGHDFWLPVDMRITGSLKIGLIGLRFPRMKLRLLSKLANYRVNVPLPDSLFSKNAKQVRIDSSAARHDSLFISNIQAIPLTRQEQHAYEAIDSTQTLEKAFQPHGLLARIIDFSNDDESSAQRSESSSPRDSTTENTGAERWHIAGDFLPQFRYNRVDGLFGGVKYRWWPVSPLRLHIDGGYSTALKKFSYGGGARYRWSSGRFTPQLHIAYEAGTTTRYQSQIITPLLASVPNLLGYNNYFDYYRAQTVDISARLTDRQTKLSLQAGFKISEEQPLAKTTSYDILGQKSRLRANPPIDEGRLQALHFEAGYNLDENYTFGVVGQKRLALDVLYSDAALGSDFNFTRYGAHLDWSFDTFFKRRLFPNTLNLNLDAGTFHGHLPLQNFGITDVAPNIVSLFGGLRTARFRPYEGEQYTMLNAEHNFRTVPFELLGLHPLVDQNIGLIVFGGAAKTWISDERAAELRQRQGYTPHSTDGTHLEAGLSLTGILDLFRVDFARRLDKPGFLISIGVTRFR